MDTPEYDHAASRRTIETQLATYLEIALIVSEEETLNYIRSRIAELEQKLRQLDQ